ncbi:MAG: FAD-binding oxidoreductase [Proteobacteria bacterium]|nr:FAD-binding oxidoreductase [Pseudomonadota bacterium]
MPADGLTQLLTDLRAAAGDNAVSASPADLFAYSRDLWPRLTVEVRDRRNVPLETPPAAVVRPVDEAAVERVVQVLGRHGVAAVPYGAGSGVCGGAAPLYGGVVVDLKRLDTLDPVDDGSLQVTVGPGLILQTMEERLNDAGYTLGHFPSSIYCCSIGGCVAARGAGQLSSRYGKIEDMVTGLRVVTPELGIVSTGSMDPSCPTTDWSPLFIGSEGTLGMITSMRLRVHPLAPSMQLRGVRFPSVAAGIEAFREILQNGMRPSVMRLYDPLDTWMAMQKSNDAEGEADAAPEAEETPRVMGSVVSPGTVADGVLKRFRRRGRRHRSVEGEGLLAGVKEKLISDKLKDLMKPENLPVDKLLANPSLLNKTIGLLPGRCLAIFGTEGEEDVARDQLEGVIATARRLGGVDLGAGPGERWLRTRYHVSFKLPKLLGNGGFADTMETAAPWTKVEALYDAVRAAASPHVLVMAHLSHAYHEGCSIYFTLVGYHADPERAAELYKTTWNAVLAAALSVGATITHHHGVGVLKRDFMDAEHGDGRALFEAARAAIDPDRRMNPGKLFPDEVPAPGPSIDDPDAEALVVHEYHDGVIQAGLDWRGVDLAAELSLRGHFLPTLGRDFLEGTVRKWLEGGALAAHAAVHGMWEHPLLAVDGRLADGRAWTSGRLPRSAAGPSWLPFARGDAGARAVMATFRTLTSRELRLVGFRFPHMDRAAIALGKALRGAMRPTAGMVYPGATALGFRTVLQDAHRAREGGIVYLAFYDPDGFPEGSQQVVDRLVEAGGDRLTDDECLAWWEDHWAWPARNGEEAMGVSGPEPDEREFGRVAAVVPWKKAVLLLRAVETLTGGSAKAVGWIDAPLETGCTIRWRFATTKKGGSDETSLVPHQVESTIQTFGARIASARWERVGSMPEYVFEGRTPDSDGDRLAAAIGQALEGDA